MINFFKRLFGKDNPPTQPSVQYTEMEGSGIVIQVPKHSKNVDSDYQVTIESTHHAHIRSRNGRSRVKRTTSTPQSMRSTNHHHYHCNPVVVSREHYQRQYPTPTIPGNYSFYDVPDYRTGYQQTYPTQSPNIPLELVMQAWFDSLPAEIQEHYRRQAARRAPPTSLPNKSTP